MGKLNGIIKIEGTFDGLTFYKTADGHLIRRKGGVTKQRILNDPAYVRTRENLNEFGHSAKSAKLIRQSILVLLHQAKDSKLSSRMLQLMYRLKNLDTISVRGERIVSLGLDTAEGKLLLTGFDFNFHAPLSRVLLCPIILDAATGTVTLTQLVTAQQLHYPEGATHVRFRSGFVSLDFATGISESYYSAEALYPISSDVVDVHLSPTNVPAGNGVFFYLLQLIFLQEVNGELYPLHNGFYNSLQLIEVL